MATSIPRARSKALLLVYPNPYSALDSEGMPNGIVRFDPIHGAAGALDFIGASATFKTEKRKDAKGKLLGPRDAPEVQPLRTRIIEYDLVPQRLPHTDYHVRQISSGDLIPVDEATAKRCGLPFVPPIEAFKVAKAHAIAEWKTLYIEDPPHASWPVYILKDAKGEELLEGENEEPPTAPKGTTPAGAPAPPATPTTSAALAPAAKLLPSPLAARAAFVTQIVDAALGHVAVETPEFRAELTALGYYTAERFSDKAVGHVLLALALLYLPLPHRRSLEEQGIHILDEDGAPRLPLAVLGDMVVKAHAAPTEIDKLASQPALVALLERLTNQLPEKASSADIHAAVAAEILPAAPPPLAQPDPSATTPGGSP